jgi:hypothetical protein
MTMRMLITLSPILGLLLGIAVFGCKSTGEGMGESRTGEDSFVAHYTGHVVANLSGPDGQRMRCQFRLLRSGQGMKGGGQGQCQLPSGETIHAEFPPS